MSVIFTVIENARRRDDVIGAYADELRENMNTVHEWREINLAIIDKWSEAGLRYIKTRAWNLIGGRP